MDNEPKTIPIRQATFEDLPSIIQLLADDPLGQQREDSTVPPNKHYVHAFNDIIQDQQADIFVIDVDHTIVGVAQINYLQYLTYQGGKRAQIEGVRIHPNYRDKGLGRKLFEYLINQAKAHHCHVVQLTTDQARPEALKFYDSLGFKNTHLGLKLHL